MGRLISEFTKMPGIGPKSAQRLAFYILQASEQRCKRTYQHIAGNEEKGQILLDLLQYFSGRSLRDMQ